MSTPSAMLLRALAATLLAGCASLPAPIDEREIGLNRGDVFEVAKPAPFAFADGPVTLAPKVVPLPGSGEPPMITHAVDEHLPLTARSNECLTCHDKPQNIGKPVAAGKARPAPASHYRAAAEGARAALRGAQYNCMSCHAPQAAVPVLVRNMASP